MIKVGVTGHQAREGMDWTWVQHTLRAELVKLPDVGEALTSLAAGTDQLFAQVALSLHVPTTAVIPLSGYERYFQGEALSSYRRLSGQCRVINLGWKGDEERAFFEAGKYIVKKCGMLIAVWDGEKSDGLGGTADVVHFAEKSGKKICHINPIIRSVEYI